MGSYMRLPCTLMMYRLYVPLRAGNGDLAHEAQDTRGGDDRVRPLEALTEGQALLL